MITENKAETKEKKAGIKNKKDKPGSLKAKLVRGTKR